MELDPNSIAGSAGGIIGAVQNGWQFATFLVIAGCVMLWAARRDKIAKDSADMETMERIKKRDEEHLKRDHRIDELEQQLLNLGKRYDAVESRMEIKLEAIFQRLNQISGEVSKIGGRCEARYGK